MLGTKNSILCAAMAGGAHVAPALAAFAGGIDLRIMPLGASITHGQESTDGNGYRLTLYNDIVAGGNAVDMVGSNPNGTMSDPDNEGWPGYIVDEVHSKASLNVPATKPNVVLINAGTNDCVRDLDLPGAYGRMESLVNDLYSQSPQVTVVLSTLLVNGDADADARVDDFNAQMLALVADQQAAGRPIVGADMQPEAGGPELGDLTDGTHPNDFGYEKMAALWFQALADADARGFLREAEAL